MVGISGLDRSPRIPSWTQAKWLKSTKFSTRRAALQCQSYCGIRIVRYDGSPHSGKSGSGRVASFAPSSPPRQTQISPACSAAANPWIRALRGMFVPWLDGIRVQTPSVS
jgi:hypothetical protein